MQNVQDFNLLCTDPVKDQIIAVGPPPHAAIFPIRQQRERARHPAQALAPLIQFGDEGFGAGWIVFPVDVELTVGLMLGSVITIVPLMCFAGAAMRLQLTTLGFFQYLSPSLSLALAIWVFAEPLPLVRALTFACIWLALVVSSMDAMLHHRRMTSAARG